MNQRVMLAASLIVASALVADASDTAQRRIPTLQLGKCSITLLDADGIKPLKGAKLELSQAADGEAVLSATANNAGLCEIIVAEGRYILSVNERPITLINASAEGEIAWARIVVSETPMLIGGQEGAAEGESGRRLFTFFGLQGGKAVGAALLTGAAVIGGGYAIYDHNKSDDDVTRDDPAPPVLPPLPPPVSP